MDPQTGQTEDIDTVLNALIETMKVSTSTIEERIFSNIRVFIIPYIEQLRKMDLNEAQLACLYLIESNLEKLSSPLINNIRQFELTPLEIQVANLIREGMTTKSIMKFLNKSKVAIDNHRYNLRKKLGINNKKINLRSYLLSIS